MSIYLGLNCMAALAGFVWTTLQMNCLEKDFKPNLKLPITYIFPGYLFGHYLSKFLFWDWS